MLNFFHKKLHIIVCVIASIATHAMLFAASHLLFHNHDEINTEKLPQGHHLTAEISFVPPVVEASVKKINKKSEHALSSKKTKPTTENAESAFINKTDHAPKDTSSSFPSHFDQHTENESCNPLPGNKMPTFPEHARSTGHEAGCIVQLHILAKSGQVDSLKIVNPGHECTAIFQDAAITALRTWKFQKNVNAKPGHVITKEIPVRFTLVD